MTHRILGGSFYPRANSKPKSVMRQFLIVFLAGPLFASSAVAQSAAEPLAAYRQQVRPILASHCFGCHGEKKQESDLRLDTLSSDLSTSAAAETWHDVLNKLNLGEMPPEDEKQLTKQQHGTLVNWLTSELKRTEEIRRRTDGRVVLRRLNRDEYQNTMRDLLGLDLNYAGELPPEPSSRDGFKNNGSALGMSSLQLEYYLEAARSALAKALVSGPQPQVYKYRAEKSDPTKRKNAPTSNRLDGNAKFLARVMEFPRTGEIRVRIRARAEVPNGVGYPRLQVSLGVRSDTLAPQRVLGEADVVPGDPQDFEFRGRIEEFPLPGHNPKFPGLVVTAHNVYGDGNTKPPAKQKKKNNDAQAPADPTQPIIVVESLEFEGPLFDAWPPASHTQVLFPPDPSWDEAEYVEAVLNRFMTRAYRRPVTETDTAPLRKLFLKIRPNSASLVDAIRDVLAMVLVSPDFLYLVEPDNTGERRPLNDFELASRMSYFLWSSMPDARLFELAGAGKLRDPVILESQTRAMLEDAKVQSFINQFTDQWLNLSGIDRVAVNPEYYPAFDDRLKPQMRRETQQFFAEILLNDLSGLNLIESDFAMLNRPLAEHYGMTGPRGMTFERVELKPEHRRGGLLTQAAVLLANSTGEDSHPIRRAVWLLDRLLDSPPPPPPPDVPELNPEEPSLAGLSVKRQLEVHRKKEACNNCHRGIDPWGIPFENYDAIGKWRDEVRRVSRKGKVDTSPVVASATLPGDHKVAGLGELKSYLLEHERERFARALVRKLLAYSLGRSLELTDESAVDALSERFVKCEYRLSDLLVAIVQSEPFQSK